MFSVFVCVMLLLLCLADAVFDRVPFAVVALLLLLLLLLCLM